MKVAVVPAQVTSVEDRIAGRLGLSQILLLVAPVFVGSLLYMLLPPVAKTAPYKLAFIVTVWGACALLAIRVKGTIVLLRLITRLQYNLRPRYYVFDKCSVAGREMYTSAVSDDRRLDTTASVRRPAPRRLSPTELVQARDLLDNPAAQMHIRRRKGGLYVHITEVRP